MLVTNRQNEIMAGYSLVDLLVDSHCHLDFFPDLKPVILRAKQHGVSCMVSCATNLGSIKKHLLIQKEFVEVKICLGIHPVDFLKMKSADAKKALLLLEKNAPKCVAVGEIGLDNKYAKTVIEKKAQEEIFRLQVRAAIENYLPVVVHARFAEQQALQVLKEEGAKKVLMHWFTNSVESVLEAQKSGYFMSCGPIIHSSVEALEIAKKIPQDLLLLETDAPVSFLEKQSEPFWIKGVLEKMSGGKGAKMEVLAKKTTKNAQTLFGL